MRVTPDRLRRLTATIIARGGSERAEWKELNEAVERLLRRARVLRSESAAGDPAGRADDHGAS